MRQGIPERPWARLRARMVPGTETFRRSLRVRGSRLEMTELRRLEKRTRWEEVVRAVETIRKEAWKDFRDRHGDGAGT